MDEKNVMNSFFKLYSGILLFFLSALFLNSGNFFSLNLLNIGIFIAAFLIPFSYVFFALRELKQKGINIKIDKETLKNVKLAPIIIGFVLISIGIGLLGISQPTIWPDGTPTGGFWHPYLNQGFLLFFTGIGIHFFELVWYYDSVSSKIVKEAKLPL